jgi:hypothetical protein
MHFLSFSQTQVIFKKPICKEVPESFRFLTSRSLLCTQDRGKNGEDAIGSLGELAGAAHRIWARPAAVAGRRRVEVGLGMGGARFLHADGKEWGPATAHSGAPKLRDAVGVRVRGPDRIDLYSRAGSCHSDEGREELAVVWRTGGDTVDGPAGNDRCGQAANAWRGGVRDVLGRVQPRELAVSRKGVGGARKTRVAGGPRRGARGCAWRSGLCNVAARRHFLHEHFGLGYFDQVFSQNL